MSLVCLQPDIERHNAPPSRVLHVRGLRDYASENDIVDSVKSLGRVVYVMMIPRNRQALVEFEVSIYFLKHMNVWVHRYHMCVFTVLHLTSIIDCG